jgi:streptogramin lyase
MGIAGNGTDLWVANLSSNSVAEISCGTGSSIRSINSGSLNSPVAVAVGGTKVWVASQAHQTDAIGNIIPNSSFVTAYGTSNGSLEESINGTNVNDLNGSSGISVSGGNVWITNANGNSVTELDATTGNVVRDVEGGAGGFKWPMGIASTGADVWVANLDGNSLTEINESTGSVMRVVTGDGLNGPDSICVFGKAIWVTNLFGDSVTELNARNGSLIRVIHSKSDGFSAPTDITGGSSAIWVTNQWSNTVTELEASNGSLQRIIR